MRMHILVCVGLAIVLAACVPISPPAVTVQQALETAHPASPQESSPAQQPASPPTAIITSEQPTADTTEVVLDPEADPRAALRYSVSPGILQTAIFTLTVTETMTTTPRSFVTPAVAQPTPEVRTKTDEFTTVYGGAARLGDPWAVKEEQQTRSRNPSMNLVMNNSVVLQEGAFCWLRMGSDSDPGVWKPCEIQVGPWANVNTQPQFSMLLLPELRALLATLQEPSTADWIGAAMLNGENVHHLRFGPQQKGLHPCLLNGAALGLLGAAFWQGPVPCETSDVRAIEIEGEAWLRAGDLTLRQLRLRLTYGEPNLRIGVDRTLLLTDINQPVQIAPPSEP